MNTADLVSKQRELIEQQIELAELQAHGEPYSSRNLPLESVHKYGRDPVDVRDEDRAEIEGILGIIDRSESLICELQLSATPERKRRDAIDVQLACELGGSISESGKDLRQSPDLLPKLPPKKNDLSRYLEGANLTPKQYVCASLKWEYGFPVTEIARHQHITRKTVDEHLAAARKKMDTSRSSEKRARDKAKSGIR